MPVFEWDLDLQASEWDWREAPGPLPEIYDVSEDFWRRFEELPDFGDDLESLLESAVCHSDPSNVLRHHDCMWAGMCLSKEHKSLVAGASPTPPPPPPPPPLPAPVSLQISSTKTENTNPTNKSLTDKPKREPRRKGVIVQNTVGRSLLINSRARIPEPTRPETPPSLSESEEDEKKTVPVINVPGVSVSEVTNQVSVRRPVQQQQQHQTTNLNVQFDHNYDKSVRIDDLGVQTPSDSEEEEDDDEDGDGDEDDEEDVDDEPVEEDSEEEEIDVVSLNNTSGTVRMRNQPSSLPYNPSRELRRELQDTMASAITSSKILSVNRSVNRRINGAGRRKRKRDESEDEDEEKMLLQQQLQQQQQTLLNSRIMSSSTTTNTNGTNNNSFSSTSPRYHHPHHRRTWRRTSSTPKKSRFSTDSETDCEKRSLHNNMERMRRIGLRNAFEDLRVLIPSLTESKRAAKVNILKDSAAYVRQLTAYERSLSQKVVNLRHDQEKLRTRLSKLRRSLAAHR